MDYLQWLGQQKSTGWWHDSANPDEIALALERGASGVTTNPVLAYRALLSHPDLWASQVTRLHEELGMEQRAEELLRIVVTHAAAQLYPLYEQSGGACGYVMGQLNPFLAGDADAMLRQGLRVAAWGKNIVVKLPCTAAGIRVVEQLAAMGVAVCATINVAVSQAISVAEAYERGRRVAEQKGIPPAACIVVQQVGRLDDYLRLVAQDNEASLTEEDIQSAGIAVAKRTHGIFRQRGYHSVIMVAGLRGAHHVSRLLGEGVLFTINSRVQDMVLQDEPEREYGMDQPVDEGCLRRLMGLPEFARAYLPQGMAPNEFITYGVVQRLLCQFTESGWSPLEVYCSRKPSDRWI